MGITRIDVALTLLCVFLLSDFMERVTKDDLFALGGPNPITIPSFGKECLAKTDILFLKLSTSFEIEGMFESDV
jgi:hypothetical protein